MAVVHADIDALKGLHGALVRYRHAQRHVAAQAQDQVRMTRAALEEKASRSRAQLEMCQAEYAGCRERAAQADPDEPADCSGYARAVAQNAERLEQLQLWQQRVEAEASEFAGIAGRFDALLQDDLPRLEEHLTAIIASLEAARRVQAPSSLTPRERFMITRPEQDGDQQLRLLGDAWDQAAEHWRDGPARQFGDGQLTPLLQESRTYLEAVRKLMDTLEAADRETEG